MRLIYYLGLICWGVWASCLGQAEKVLPQPPLKVVVIGESVVDYVYSFPDQECFFQLLKSYGLKLGDYKRISFEECQRFVAQYGLPTYCLAGGSAANTASTLARLGRPVTFSWQYAKNPLPLHQKLHSLFTQSMATSGIHLRPHCILGEGETGCAITLTTPSLSERTFLTAFGKKKPLEKLFFQKLPLEGASVILVEAYLWGNPLTTPLLEETLQKAYQQGTRTVLTLGTKNVVEVYRQEFLRLLPYLNAIVGNIEEMQALIGTCDPQKVGLFFKKFQNPPLVVMTAGEKGAYIYDAHTLRQKTEFLYIPPEEILPHTLKNTSGAGDAFAAGIIEGLCRHLSAKDMGGLGAHLAAHVICQVSGRIPASVFITCPRCRLLRTSVGS